MMAWSFRFSRLLKKSICGVYLESEMREQSDFVPGDPIPRASRCTSGCSEILIRPPHCKMVGLRFPRSLWLCIRNVLSSLHRERLFRQPVCVAIGVSLLGLALWSQAGWPSPADEQTGGALPQGLGDAQWGMTAEELGRRLSVHKVDVGDQFGYAEHLEQEPDVYAGTTADGKRVEYYLYDNALYKVFVIHARNQRDPQLYQQMVRRMTADYGAPVRVYDASVFGLRISHTVWQDPVTQVDLRFGGGFVFEVHIDRARAAAKEEALRRKHSI